MSYIICIAFTVMCVLYLAFQRVKRIPGHPKTIEIALKCGATTMAALAALMGCLKCGIPAHWTMLAGLVTCIIADGVLCVHFIAGGAVFVLGHILYMAAFCMMHWPGWHHWVLLLCLAGLAAAVITRLRTRLGSRYGLILAYSMILCLMITLASAQAPLFFLGAVLFAVSDILLDCVSITRWKTAMDYTSLAMYYLGQFILGLAVYYH